MCVHRYKNRVLKRQMIKHITYARLLWRYNKVNQQRKVYVARQKTKRNDKKVHATDVLFVQRLYFINILCYFYVKYRIRYLPCNMKCNKLVALVTKIWKKRAHAHWRKNRKIVFEMSHENRVQKIQDVNISK